MKRKIENVIANAKKSWSEKCFLNHILPPGFVCFILGYKIIMQIAALFHPLQTTSYTEDFN